MRTTAPIGIAHDAGDARHRAGQVDDPAARGAVHLDLDAAAGAHARRQLLLGALRDDLARLDHQQAIAGLADLRQDVARQQDGVRATQVADQRAHLDDLQGSRPLVGSSGSAAWDYAT
jgi:hypothetical protein